jgi:hypothetical protein
MYSALRLFHLPITSSLVAEIVSSAHSPSQKKGPRLFETSPNGTAQEWKAICIGLWAGGVVQCSGSVEICFPFPGLLFFGAGGLLRSFLSPFNPQHSPFQFTFLSSTTVSCCRTPPLFLYIRLERLAPDQLLLPNSFSPLPFFSSLAPFVTFHFPTMPLSWPSVGSRAQSAKTYLEKNFESFPECKFKMASDVPKGWCAAVCYGLVVVAMVVVVGAQPLSRFPQEASQKIWKQIWNIFSSTDHLSPSLLFTLQCRTMTWWCMPSKP